MSDSLKSSYIKSFNISNQWMYPSPRVSTTKSCKEIFMESHEHSTYVIPQIDIKKSIISGLDDTKNFGYIYDKDLMFMLSLN